jgi:hypothetical protein
MTIFVVVSIVVGLGIGELRIGFVGPLVPIRPDLPEDIFGTPGALEAFEKRAFVLNLR